MSCPGPKLMPTATMSDSGNHKPFHRAPPKCYQFGERGFPRPASCKTSSSIPRPVQQSASLPSTATAGTERTPSSFARCNESGSCKFNTVTSQDGQASSLTVFSASSHRGQPAEKTSIYLVLLIFNLLQIMQYLQFQYFF